MIRNDVLDLSLTFAVLDEEKRLAFQDAFRAWPSVSVVRDRWENLANHDCFVTAGNAYGLMSAGIDAAVVHRFGPEIQDRVQLRILNEYLGEQPIGTAFLVESGSQEVRFLCHAPTMKVPGDISGTDNIYQATKAALISIYLHNKTAEHPIHTVVLPSFGTGFGRVDAREAARQMSVAYKLFLELPYPPNWDRVVARERQICWDGETRKIRR